MQIRKPDAPLVVNGHCLEEGDLPVGAERYDAFVVIDGDPRIAWWNGKSWVQAPAGKTSCPTCAHLI